MFILEGGGIASNTSFLEVLSLTFFISLNLRVTDVTIPMSPKLPEAAFKSSFSSKLASDKVWIYPFGLMNSIS